MPEGAAQCAACQGLLRPGSLFCPGCGQSLDGSAPVAPARAGSGTEARSIRPGFAENWDELKRVGWLFGLLLATSFVFGLASRGATSPWPSVAITCVDALIVAVAVAARFQRLRFLLFVYSIPKRSLAILAVQTLCLVAGMLAYFWLLKRLGVPFQSSTDKILAAGWPVWSIFVLVSLVPAVVEELAFRGVIQSSLERIFNARDAWLIQAALFSVLHLVPLIFPSHFLMGLCFGLLRMRTRSIYPGMVVHAGWNALVVLDDLSG